MNNYLIWECEYSSDKLVQVLNTCDLSSVQEEFTKQGYFIKETIIVKDGCCLFFAREVEK